MGKNDFLSPKAIGNRIKAKGLQKLRWYCQMCQKQCRDENGFKCHLTSESHKRQMMVFGQAPMRVVDGYTEEFENNFLELLRQSHGSSRVSAKVVYNEFINDRYHVHMNSTQWLTLTEFVKYLGREGKCRVDETPKGWFISLIQKDPMEQLSDERRIKRARAEKEEEDRLRDALDAQIERAQLATDHAAVDDASGAPVNQELIRADDDQPLRIALGPSAKPASHQLSRFAPGSAPENGLVAANNLLSAQAEAEASVRDPKRQKSNSSKPKSKLEQLMEREQALKQQQAARAKQAVGNAAASQPVAGNGHERSEDNWLRTGLVVKVMSKELQQHGYYKKKAVVEELINKYVAQVSMADSGDVLRIDQAQLETVLPSPGGLVLVLSGKHAGSKAVMSSVNTGKFQAQVKLADDREIWLDYEAVCKLQAPSNGS